MVVKWYTMNQNRVSKWKNRKARNFYDRIRRRLGKPVFVANVGNGMAYWKTNGLFTEHLLRDEQVSHCVPAKHHDFFYSSIKFYVPPEKLKDMLSLSGSVNYDGLKKHVTARCASLEANIATLFLALSIASGRMKIKHIKKQRLYGKYIRGEIVAHTKLKSKMVVMKRKNKRKYKKELSRPFYKLAFDSCV